MSNKQEKFIKKSGNSKGGKDPGKSAENEVEDQQVLEMINSFPVLPMAPDDNKPLEQDFEKFFMKLVSEEND